MAAQALPLSNRILYASGSLGSNALIQTLTVWVFFFYVAEEAEGRTPLAPIYLVTLALTLGRVIDAITDPIIGFWSDVTRSRWGRRVPFIVVGGPFMALTFFLIWLPPISDSSHWVNGLWLALIVQAYFLTVTIVGAPYTGIYPELAVTKEERLSVSAWELIFGMAGAGVALIATGPMIDAIGFAGMGVVVALIGVLPRYVGLLAVRGRLFYQPPETTSFEEFRHTLLGALRLTITNTNFLSLMASLVLFQAGLLMLTQVIPFFVTEVLGQTKGMQAPITGVFFISAVAIVPFVVRVTGRRDKRQVYTWCLLAASAFLPLLFWAGFLPGIPKFPQALAIIAIMGLPLSGIFILPDALLADVVDEDSRRTASRREAMYFSSRATLEKLGQAVATGAFGLLLGLFGSTAEDPLGLRLIGPAAGACTLLGWFIFTRGYRLREEASASVPTPAGRE